MALEVLALVLRVSHCGNIPLVVVPEMLHNSALWQSYGVVCMQDLSVGGAV